MDDYSITSLGESKNEWCSRLINVLTPELIQGLKSIFDEAWKLCADNDEEEKYLMTFQTFLSRVPKWNPNIIQDEITRIIERSGCTYLEELLTCVHVIHLKILTCVRVGQRQKKVDIDVPSLKDFIHKVYINIARKVYTNIYLFERNIAPLQIQKHNRELEMIIKECILNTIRENIPVDSLLRAYMDETEEQDVEVKEVEEQIAKFKKPAATPAVQTVPAVHTPSVPSVPSVHVPATHVPSAQVPSAKEDIIADPVFPSSETIKFSDIDKAMDTRGIETEINVPKTEENLIAIEKKREENSNMFGGDDDDDDDDDQERIRIGGDVNLDFTDVNDISINTLPPLLLDDIVELS